MAASKRKLCLKKSVLLVTVFMPEKHVVEDVALRWGGMKVE
jgi:hypothetical protein